MRAVVEGLRTAWRQVLVRYLVVGVVNTIFAYAVYALVLALHFAYPVACLITLVAGILMSFRTQGRYVFRNASPSLFWRFLVSWAVVYLCHVGVVALCLHLDFDAFVGGALALPSNLVVGFLLQRFFVFGGLRRA